MSSRNIIRAIEQKDLFILSYYKALFFNLTSLGYQLFIYIKKIITLKNNKNSAVIKNYDFLIVLKI